MVLVKIGRTHHGTAKTFFTAKDKIILDISLNWCNCRRKHWKSDEISKKYDLPHCRSYEINVRNVFICIKIAQSIHWCTLAQCCVSKLYELKQELISVISLLQSRFSVPSEESVFQILLMTLLPSDYQTVFLCRLSLEKLLIVTLKFSYILNKPEKFTAKSNKQYITL